jgi:hypothetical protein
MADDFEPTSAKDDFEPAAKPDARSPFRRWYDESVTKPLTGSVGKILAAPGEAILSGANAVGLRSDSPEAAAGGLQAAQKAAEGPAKLIVPQSPIEMGIVAGTAGAGSAISAAARAGVPLAGKVAPWLARILGGAAGGEAGNLAEGGPTGKGALTGAVSNAAGEVAGKAVNTAALALPGAKGEAASRFLEDLMGPIRSASPSLTVGTKAREVMDYFRGSGVQKDLSTQAQAFADAAVRRTNGAPVTLTTLGPPAAGGAAAGSTLASQPAQQIYNGASPATQAAMRAQNPGITFAGSPAAGGPAGRTFANWEDAWTAVQREGQDAYTKTGAERFKALEGYHAALDELRDALPTALRGPFDTMRQQYAAGKAAEDLLSRKNAFHLYPKAEPQLNTRALQHELEYDREELGKRFGPGFGDIVDQATRGAGLGYKDNLVSGPGSALDTARMMLQRKGGSPVLFGAPITTLFPNLGSEYAGRAPISMAEARIPGTRTRVQLGQTIQQLIDAAMAKGGARATDTQGRGMDLYAPGPEAARR